MRSSIPHYQLLATADKHDPRGQWEFALHQPDGSVAFAAADEEPDSVGERLELLSVVRGLEALEQPSRVTIVNPPRYVRRGLEVGLPQWRANDWLWDAFGARVPVKDCDLWQRIDRALQFHQVECRRLRVDRPASGRGSAIPAAHARFTNSEVGTRPAAAACESVSSRRGCLADVGLVDEMDDHEVPSGARLPRAEFPDQFVPARAARPSRRRRWQKRLIRAERRLEAWGSWLGRGLAGT